MQNARALAPFSKIAFAAIFAGLFFLFTPFEGADNTMFPKYFAAGASIFLLAPLILLRKAQLSQPSVLVLLVLSTIVFHMVVAKSVPPQFILLVAANLALAIVAYEARFSYEREFEAAVACLLIINVVAIAIQAILFYFVTGSIYDIHFSLFGLQSRVAEDYLNIARFTGMHVEPGTYTNYVSCLLVIYVMSSDVNKRVMLISVLSMFSVLLTHSASSIFFVAVMLVLFGWLWPAKITLIHVLAVAGAIVFYFVSSNFLEHLLTRFDTDDGSLSLKVLGINTYRQASVEDKLIGLGFGGDPCVNCHYQDVGVVLNLISRGGIIVTFAVALLYLRAIKLHGIILATVLYSIPVYCIMSFYEAPVWMFMLFATSSSKLLDKRVKAAAQHRTATVLHLAALSDHGAAKTLPSTHENELAHHTRAPLP